MILIVDDEPGIRHVLEGMLKEEGYQSSSVDSGDKALEFLQDKEVKLVLLDIWMPGQDGMQVLKEIKERFPETKVIMMSGHASISTAVKATQLGAADFLEKPLDSEGTLRVIKNALESIGREAESSDALDLEPGTAKRLTGTLNTEVFRDDWSRGERFKQKTLARSAVMYGQGLHSGKRSGLLLEPLPENSGIHFVGVSDEFPVPAHVNFVESTGWATTLRLGKTQAGTIEHLMSALHAYGISNLLIKCNHEVPVMDGSAREFCELFDRVGVVEQEADWYAIRVKEPFEVKKGEEFIRIEPSDEFSVQYTLKYPRPLGLQEYEFTLNDPKNYFEEISKARTFGFMRDLGKLQAQGLALGGRLDNCVLFGEDGSLNGELRYENEPVRHKILDAIGDLFLLGRRIQGRVVAHMTGHSDNVAILKALWDARA
jgi:UDP-3-O-acyl N-acetylglucosamine deacetylase